ncbi:MAG: HD domain-containing protein [Bacteroidales bacterium]|nr:HD domain-containing protein [Bacteroidales bacterium]
MQKTTQEYLIQLENLFGQSALKVSHDDAESIKKAFFIAEKCYGDKLTPDGKSLMERNLDIAEIAVREIGLGPTSAICSLLHSICPDGDYGIKQIRADFGDQVADILEGFVKISNLATERISLQSETFRTLFLSIVDDMRVILIRLAHRLSDIRHPEWMKGREQLVFDEVKYLYAPMAHRLGLYRVKAEFEEQVMLFEHPEIYRQIENQLQQTKTKREVYIKDFVRPIEREMHRLGFDFSIKWRAKSIPSVWAKMKNQQVDFEEVFDLFAVRIIINSKAKSELEDCWRAYSVVTNIYQPNPKRLRDWVTVPKSTGYESLHTTVLGLDNRWVEVQIRSVRMDEVAEKGQAAHWQYKGVMNRKNTEDWLSQVRDILENPNQPKHDDSYRSATKSKQQSVFVFTPKGDLKQFPSGSTILDFAFGIHTDVGSTCRGAKVNEKVMPIRYVLRNGDRIDVITSKNQKPKLDWLSFVATEKARTRIKRALKEEKYKVADLGKEILTRKLKNWKIKNSDLLISHLVKHYKVDAGVDLYYLFAVQKIDLADVKIVALRFVESQQDDKIQDREVNQEIKGDSKSYSPDDESEDVLYIGENLKNVEYRLAKCCTPIPGDKVFGFITTQGGITIHRKNCPNAARLLSHYAYRVMEVKWISSSQPKHWLANLKITGKDELGVVGAITKVITDDLRVNMRSVNFQTKGKQFEGRISVHVRDNEHLDQLIHKLGKVQGVEKIVRLK